MTTKKDIFITIPGSIDSEQLYQELKNYSMNVTNLVTRTYVYGTVDLADPLIEYIIQICYKYGNIQVDLVDIPEQKAPN